MKKLLIAAAALVTGFSLMADEPTYTETIRDTLRGLLNERLEGLSTNLNFRSWNRLSEINQNFNTKLLNNSAFEKTVSTYFNEQVMNTLTRITPETDEGAALFEQGYRYKATVDFSDFSYAFTENADKTGFDVAESDSGALEVYYTAKSEDDLPPGGGEEPPPGMEPPPGAGDPPATITQRITLAAGGDSFELLVPHPNNSMLVVIVRFPETFALEVADRADEGDWETIFITAINNTVVKADPAAPYVSLRNDGWNVRGVFSMLPPSDSPDPTVAITFDIGQDPEQNLAGINLGIVKDDEMAASLTVVVTNMSEEAKTFDFTSIDSLAEFATAALADCSVTDFEFRLSDRVALHMAVADSAEVIRIRQQARRYRNRGEDTLENIQNIASNLNEHITCTVDVSLPGLPVLNVPLELRAVKFGTDYVIVPAFQFDPTAGEDGWVALTDMVTQEAVTYALNIVDHALEPAHGALVAGLQLTKYIRSLVSQRLSAESIVPDSMAEMAAEQLKNALKASALNANFTSWESFNSLNQYFNENVLNNPEFDKTVLELFNRKIMNTISPAKGEVAVKGYAYQALVDVYNVPYTLTAKDDFSGFEVSPSESGAFEMVTPFRPNENANGSVKVTVVGSGDPTLLFGPSARNKDLAIVLDIPSKVEFTIAVSMNGSEYRVCGSGGFEATFTKANADSDFVSLVTDSWTVSGTLATSFTANPKFEKDDATTLTFEFSQDVPNNLGTVQFAYTHNDRKVVDVSATTTATGEFMDFSSLSMLSSIDDVIGMLAATRGAKQVSVSFFDRIGIEFTTENGAKLREVTKAIVENRRKNADYETIDALTQQLNEIVDVNFVVTELPDQLTLPMTFVTVPFGVTFNASPAIIFPDDEENPVPVAALFDDEARGYLMNIIDQAMPPVLGTATTVKQLAVALRSVAQNQAGGTTVEDVEDVVYGDWEATDAATIAGAVMDADDDIAGTIQLKVSKANKKGSVRVSGTVTTIDGKKHMIKSTSVQLPDDGPLVIEGAEVKDLGTLSAKVGENSCYGSIGDSYYFTDADIGGAWAEEGSVVNVDFSAGVDLPEGMTEETMELLPSDEPINVRNGKWAFNKAAKVTMSNGSVTVDTAKGKTNVSAMKLIYTPKTGVFKGSFKIYTVNNSRIKKYTVKVTGVVVDGFGYGTTTMNKKPTGWAVTVD